MKIYRVSARNSTEGHVGYSFHSNKRKAEETRREALDNLGPDHEPEAVVEVLELRSNRREDILSFLNLYASHNNNG